MDISLLIYFSVSVFSSWLSSVVWCLGSPVGYFSFAYIHIIRRWTEPLLASVISRRVKSAFHKSRPAVSIGSVSVDSAEH